MSEEKMSKKQDKVESLKQSEESLSTEQVEADSGEFDLAAELDKSKALANENYERFLRVSADFENLRKRSEKERVDLIRFGSERLLKDLLSVIDSFQKALPSEDEDTAAQNPGEFVKGMHLIFKQLTDVLSKNGLKALESAGEAFDPNFHQAIQRIEKEDVTDELVQDEFQKGYLLHDKLIRPAMVSVVVPGTETEAEN
jgi:molecular chaperone GrpE